MVKEEGEEEEEERGAGRKRTETCDRAQKYPAKLQIIWSITGKAFSSPGLVHPMELFILPASSTFTSCRPLRHTRCPEFGDPAAERLQDDLSTLGSVGDGVSGPHSQHHLHRGRRGCITPTATTTLARRPFWPLVKHSSLSFIKNSLAFSGKE